MTSTITVVKKGGCVAIAADTLTSYGSQRESAAHVVNHEKILRVGESYLAVCGPSAAKLVLADYFSDPEREVCLESVGSIFRTWVAMHGALKEHYFLVPEEDSDDQPAFEHSGMTVLVANSRGIFGVDRHRFVQEYTRFHAYGRGDEYALGAMVALYDDPALTAEQIACRGVEAAAEFEEGTALPVTSYSLPLAER